jgi:hypothetical protein
MKTNLILALKFFNAPNNETVEKIQGDSNPFARVITKKPSLIWSREMNGPNGTLLQIDVEGLYDYATKMGAKAIIFTNHGNLRAYLARNFC